MDRTRLSATAISVRGPCDGQGTITSEGFAQLLLLAHCRQGCRARSGRQLTEADRSTVVRGSRGKPPLRTTGSDIRGSAFPNARRCSARTVSSGLRPSRGHRCFPLTSDSGAGAAARPVHWIPSRSSERARPGAAIARARHKAAAGCRAIGGPTVPVSSLAGGGEILTAAGSVRSGRSG